ncbi:hypothetical protein M407DRAFT_151085 [Tulasnella calospora MUT 4182]|uniref:Uncharacterized protein n=1 Tax=Tulasnella calospora MUT 4182 TaxID=1051891 RepID=A0A0C3QY68_9AGAM|nr:hypothetical protein M407DRAFT_151085 [Tulasnella calospora MUT 4182]
MHGRQRVRGWLRRKCVTKGGDVHRRVKGHKNDIAEGACDARNNETAERRQVQNSVITQPRHQRRKYDGAGQGTRQAQSEREQGGNNKKEKGGIGN